jgi:hypothetical protein
MMAGRIYCTREIPRTQAKVVGANIRVLRQRNGWTQAKLGALTVWPGSSTVVVQVERVAVSRAAGRAGVLRVVVEPRWQATWVSCR